MALHRLTHSTRVIEWSLVKVLLPMTIFVVLMYGCVETSSTPAQTQPTTTTSPPAMDRIRLWDDGSWYLLGVNYPWLHYGHDFGQAMWPTGSWSHDGVSAIASRQHVEEQFTYLQNKGVHVIRWFLFGDGRASPEFDAEGFVIGFDAHLYDDIDMALSLACKYDIRIIFVLLDYLWFDEPELVNGVQLGGHADVVVDTAKRQSFYDNALIPLLQRYGNKRQIIAWDVMNEPEWAVSDIPDGGTTEQPVTIAEMQTFVGGVVSHIHDYSSQSATIGSARGEWLSFWQDMELDFYQFHHFGPMNDQPPFGRFSGLGLDRPAILGEFPTMSTDIGLLDYLSSTWDNGYAGALAWSLNGSDNSSDFNTPGPADEFYQWSRSHNRDVNIPDVCKAYLPMILK